MDVTIEIDELVLAGVDRPDLVAAAFVDELTRLVRRDGVAVSEISDLPDLPVVDGAVSPERFGVALARSVHAGLRGQGDRAVGRDGGSGVRPVAQGGSSAGPQAERGGRDER